ncbi:hypothetical protein [Gordonia hankookensis]|uniref:Uncharacterized protein n=1 Tax=Gordonia hankookensis TaxID=589403 RepID=A0ABR7WD08_9ACTN|nr:hypothetical protein [Gordonia hankookensis]MBD1320431.1 hypothetical protein [Gordonia hankookensis]
MANREPAGPVDRALIGDPVTIDEHTTFIPVTRKGVRGRPVAVGAFTVTDGATTWTPAVDQGRVALIGVMTGLIAAALGSAAVLRQPPWPRMTITEDRPGRSADPRPQPVDNA